MRIVVQDAPFDAGAEVNAFTAAQSAAQPGAGAIVTFTGVVRNSPGGDLDVMQIEHYPGMTQNALKSMAHKAMQRWELADVLIIHRYGDLRPGDQIMMVATASRHRKGAFEAAEYLMDYLKSRAPFWKNEITKDGSQWVDAKDDDEAALDRWSQS